MVKDNIRNKAQWDRVFALEDHLFPAFSNTMELMKKLDDLTNTRRVLFATDGDEKDPHFYLLVLPNRKTHIPLAIRPFISSLDKDSLFLYKILKIRRRGWVLTNYENAGIINDPARLKELMRTQSFIRAKELIDSGKAQLNLRRTVWHWEWKPGPDGRYRIHRTSGSDNLINPSLALFKKFPDPEGYIGTSEIVYDYEKEIPQTLKYFSLFLWLKDRKEYKKTR